MNIRRLATIGLAACSICASTASLAAQRTQSRLSTTAIATQDEAAPARVPARTQGRIVTAAPAETPADSVAEDLQRIVVLCATEPTSEQFKTAWVSYVRRHRVTEANLDGVIDDIIERAEAYNAERSNPRTNRMLTVLTTTKATMHDTAKAAINNVR